MPLDTAAPERRVTLSDIAKRAGVHVTTVSLALRNQPRLPLATRERLQTLAREMGYVPDPVMQALVAYRSKIMPRRNPPTIAYVTNWNTRWGWREVTAHPDFYEGAKAKAEELGFTLDHFWMREPGLTHGRLSRILDARGIHGVIIASHVREFDTKLQFDWSRFSAVKIDYFPHQPELANVTNDQMHIIRLAVRKALAAGYRRIGFVMDEGWDISVDRLWSAGFLWEQQSIPPEERIEPLLFPARESFREWFERNRPEVVISKGEFVLPEFKAMGLRIPRDVAFVDLFLEDVTGKVAGVRQNHRTVGALAVEMLAGQMQQNKRGIPEIPTVTYVEGTWFDGKTMPAHHSVRTAPVVHVV